MKFTRRFKIHGEYREFMYLYKTKDRAELKEMVDFVKERGDMYRITWERGGLVIWDARI